MPKTTKQTRQAKRTNDDQKAEARQQARDRVEQTRKEAVRALAALRAARHRAERLGALDEQDEANRGRIWESACADQAEFCGQIGDSWFGDLCREALWLLRTEEVNEKIAEIDETEG